VSFAVDPEGLRATGRALAETAARTSDDLERLERAVQDGGSAPWAPLGPVYHELIALTGEALGLVGGGLAKSGAETQRMADAYDRTEDIMVRLTVAVLATLSGDAYLGFEGEIIHLVRTKGKLTITPDESLWTPETEALLPPHDRAELPNL
jgi:hypothetical protein